MRIYIDTGFIERLFTMKEKRRKAKLLKVLEANDGLCMDNWDERDKLVDALWEEIKGWR